MEKVQSDPSLLTVPWMRQPWWQQHILGSEKTVYVMETRGKGEAAGYASFFLSTLTSTGRNGQHCHLAGQRVLI